MQKKWNWFIIKKELKAKLFIRQQFRQCKKKKKNIYLLLKVQEISFHISNKKIQKARPPGLNAKKEKKKNKKKATWTTVLTSKHTSVVPGTKTED